MIQSVHGGRGPRKDQLEEGDHDGREDQRPPDGVEKNPVDGLAGPVLFGSRVKGVGHDRVDPPGALQGVFGGHDDRSIPLLGPFQEFAEAVDAEAAMADDSNDGNPQGGLKSVDIEFAPPGSQFVDHREHEARGKSASHDLADEHQRPRQRTGVSHDGNGVGGVIQFAGEHAGDHAFVLGDRVEAIGSRQVDNHGPALAKGEAPLAPFDGDTRVVSHPCPQSGECVEEGCLSGVGAADEADSQSRPGGVGGQGEDSRFGATPGWGWRRTWIRDASLRRRQS